MSPVTVVRSRAAFAAEAFDLDSARLTVPLLDDLDLPQLRATVGVVVNAAAAPDTLGGQMEDKMPVTPCAPSVECVGLIDRWIEQRALFRRDGLRLDVSTPVSRPSRTRAPARPSGRAGGVGAAVLPAQLEGGAVVGKAGLPLRSERPNDPRWTPR